MLKKLIIEKLFGNIPNTLFLLLKIICYHINKIVREKQMVFC